MPCLLRIRRQVLATTNNGRIRKSPFQIPSQHQQQRHYYPSLSTLSKTLSTANNYSSNIIKNANNNVYTCPNNEATRFIHSQYSSSLSSSKTTLHDKKNTRFIYNQNKYNPKIKSPIQSQSFATSSTKGKTTTTTTTMSPEEERLTHLRNVGILAHVDAGKTTVTERMLALGGVIHRVGSVDAGNTVTDYLPAERERGITIQSAAIGLEWSWGNYSLFGGGGAVGAKKKVDSTANSNTSGSENVSNRIVSLNLIDTPGHVDFSVEVHRSVAVLDGAVLVIDSVAGVQAQTEGVWRAMMTRSTSHSDIVVDNDGSGNTSSNSMDGESDGDATQQTHVHEPLSCIAFVNKMDKEGCNFGQAMNSLRLKLQGANPVAIQIPLFLKSDYDDDSTNTNSAGNTVNESDNNNSDLNLSEKIVAIPPNDNELMNMTNGNFCGVVDLIQMRAILWPQSSGDSTMNNASSDVSNVDEYIPTIIKLPINNDNQSSSSSLSTLMETCQKARQDLIASLAEVNEEMEEYYLLEEDPSNRELGQALRKATIQRSIMPVMTGAALRGKGVEPLLDAVVDLLPSPLDRAPPSIIYDQSSSSGGGRGHGKRKKRSKKSKNVSPANTNNTATTKDDNDTPTPIRIGHPQHPSLLALAFKVIHMKSKGSGEGRVVFTRVYSGKLHTRDTIKVISPSNTPNQDISATARTERVGGMLELAGGRFDNLSEGACESGGVCALVGLKTVVTGDTILLANSPSGIKGSKKKKKKGGVNVLDEHIGDVCLAGVASPTPVLTVRLEAETGEQQTKLSEVLKLLVAEDPSLHVKEDGSATLLSGLGELHIEVVVDRIMREHGLSIWTGKPSVAYRETVVSAIESDGLVKFDRTIGSARMQASIHLLLEPWSYLEEEEQENAVIDPSSSVSLSDPLVVIGPNVKKYLGLLDEEEGQYDEDDEFTDEELAQQNELVHALISGCQGALKRGPTGSYPLANVKCTVVDIDAEGGLAALNAMPGSLRAAASLVLSSMLSEQKDSCSVLEPTMSVEISAPSEMVGSILSDLTSRRGNVGDIVMGGGGEGQKSSNDQYHQAKANINAEAPLVELLGYANRLRSITGGEGAFSAEYKGHTHCDEIQ